MSVGLEYLSCLLQSESTEYYKYLCPKHYLTASENQIYTYIVDSNTKYGITVTLDEIHAQFGILLPVVKQPSLSLYFEKLEERFIQNNLRDIFEKVAESINNGSPKQAFNYIQSQLAKMYVVKSSNTIFDFRDSGKILERETEKIVANVADRICFGWPYLDDNFPNIFTEELVSIVARSGMGKTFLMLYIAYNTWVKYDQPIVFITLEMSYSQILQRLSSIHLGKNIGNLDRVRKETFEDVSWLFAEMGDLKGHSAPFYVIDGEGSTSTSDVISIIKQLKARVCFIDGAYMLDVEGYTSDNYAKIGQVVRALKSYAREQRIPVFASWQLNRKATEVKDIKDIGLEHLGLSDQIGNYSALVLAILQENPLEAHTMRDVSVLKGRYGHYGNFKINYIIRDDKVDFSQHRELMFGMGSNGEMLIDDEIEL